MAQKEIEKEYIEKINQLKKYDKAYFEQDNPIISDANYDKLKENGVYNNTTIIFKSDHGKPIGYHKNKYMNMKINNNLWGAGRYNSFFMIKNASWLLSLFNNSCQISVIEKFSILYLSNKSLFKIWHPI